jgi:hypothetical protein
MATATERIRFRLMVGDNDASNEVFGDSEIDSLFTWAAEDYAGNSAAKFAQACLYGIRTLKADAAKQVTYKQNLSTENLSDLFKHLDELQKDFEDDLAEAVTAASGSVRLSATKKRPLREKGVPRS